MQVGQIFNPNKLFGGIFIPDRLMRRKHLSAPAKLLWARLAQDIRENKTEEGWIHKTAEELEVETGLSYKEQLTARARLKEAGLLEEKYERLTHKMYFRANLEFLTKEVNQ